MGADVNGNKETWTATVVAGIAGTLMCAATIYLSYTRLKEPDNSLDWAALIFSGLVTGIVVFMVTWGHFQDDPKPTPIPTGRPLDSQGK